MREKRLNLLELRAAARKANSKNRAIRAKARGRKKIEIGGKKSEGERSYVLSEQKWPREKKEGRKKKWRDGG